MSIRQELATELRDAMKAKDGPRRDVIRQIETEISRQDPIGSFEPFSDLSKGIMIALMWIGRLEIVPVAVLLTRAYWRA